MQATLLNYGGQHGYGRCSIASQGSLEEDECDSSEELIGSASGGGQSESQALGAQPKLAPISGCLGPTTVFRLQFLGSVEVEEEGGRKRRKRLKNHMVEEAVTKIKVRPHCPSSQSTLFAVKSVRLPFDSYKSSRSTVHPSIDLYNTDKGQIFLRPFHLEPFYEFYFIQPQNPQQFPIMHFLVTKLVLLTIMHILHKS